MILKNGSVLYRGEIQKKDLWIKDQKIYKIADVIEEEDEITDCRNLIIIPSFMDPHVHTRTPGYTYKEDLKTLTNAAYKGGVTTLFAMPNVKPVPYNLENYRSIDDLIHQETKLTIHQLASITRDLKGEEISDIENLSSLCRGFSDDGFGVQSPEKMREAMQRIKEQNSLIVCHCEDEKYVRSNNEKAEYHQLKRDLKLVQKTKVRYHMCHISTKKSMQLINRYKKKSGLQISVEVCPHHLILKKEDIREGNTKMNPPLRSKKDVKYLVKNLLKGNIDCIASDHAPHSREEKLSYEKSLNGIIGIETSFYLLYTYFVARNRMTLAELNHLMNESIAEIFQIEPNRIEEGSPANLVIFDPKKEWIYTEDFISSKSKNTPFIGYNFKGKIKSTLCHGENVYEEESICQE